MIKKKIVLIFLPLFLLFSCGTGEIEPEPASQYDKAEVYYLKNPCWQYFGFNVKLDSFF